MPYLYIKAFLITPLLCITVIWLSLKIIQNTLMQEMKEMLTTKAITLPIGEIANALVPTMSELVETIKSGVPWAAKNIFCRRWYQNTINTVSALSEKTNLEEILKTVFDEIELPKLISHNTLKSNSGVLNKITKAIFPLQLALTAGTGLGLIIGALMFIGAK
jgi:hypothetical protein